MKTTAKDFKLFRGYCKKWQAKLGLTAYTIIFQHKKWEEDEDEIKAWVKADMENHVARISLSVEWKDEVTKRELEATALHEILEIRMANINDHLARYYSDKLVNTLRHEIIRTFENLFFP